MKKIIFTFLPLLFFLSITMTAQTPYAFRYQASIHDTYNNPITSDVEFKIVIYNDADATNEVYCENHIAQPDTNGLVAFSIGEGSTDDDFSSITWGNGPYYIQIIIDNEEISYSQLVSVPYAMHAQTADELYDLQEPINKNDPTTKYYVDINDSLKIDSLSKALEAALQLAKAYADSLAISPKDLVASVSGDSLVIGNKTIVISGLSSNNQEEYDSQLLLGGSYNESVTTTLRCSDSSIIVLATTESANGNVDDFKGDADIWVIKMTASLDIEWAKTLGGSNYDNGILIIEETDGFLIGATTESSDGDVSEQNGEFDLWLVKLNASGTISWEKSYGGSGTEFINAIIPKDDGGYYIGATSYSTGGDITYLNGESDIWILNIDENQNIINSQTIGGSSYDALVSMTLDNDELILFATSSSNDGDITSNNGNLDFVKITLNTNLAIQEQNCYGTTSNEQLCIIDEFTEGTLLCGHTFANNWSASSSASYKNIYLKRLGSNEWEEQFGGEKSDILVDVNITNDTITLLAQTSSQTEDISKNNGGSDIWLLQISPDGNITKNAVFGGTYDETPKVLKTLPNGGWLIGAESKSYDGDVNNNNGEKDVWLLKLDRNFNIISSNVYGGSYDETITDIQVISNNKAIIYGTTSSDDYGISGLHDKEGESNDIWILKTDI